MMTYWFYRNYQKDSGPVSFEILDTRTANSAASQLSRELKKHRDALLQAFREPLHEIKTVENITGDYLSLLYGLLYNIDDATGSSRSKLENLVEFKWTSSICKDKSASVAQFHSDFEVASVGLTFAMWCMRHASFLAEKSDITKPQVLEVQNSLKKAAEIFHYVKENVITRLEETPRTKTTDVNLHVVEAYKLQCIAEAQEVTVIRAITLGRHEKSLISALANETSMLYSQAANSLKSVDVKKARKWAKYLELKRDVHLAHANYYNGILLFEKEECGSSIRALGESGTLYEKALNMFRKDFKRDKDTIHAFFLKKLETAIKNCNESLEKSRSDNNLIRHKRIPQEVPELERQPTHGSIELSDFQLLMTPHKLWTKDLYDSFDGNSREDELRNEVKQLSLEVEQLKEQQKASKDDKEDKANIQAPEEQSAPSTEKQIELREKISQMECSTSATSLDKDATSSDSTKKKKKKFSFKR